MVMAVTIHNIPEGMVWSCILQESRLSIQISRWRDICIGGRNCDPEFSGGSYRIHAAFRSEENMNKGKDDFRWRMGIRDRRTDCSWNYDIIERCVDTGTSHRTLHLQQVP